MVNICYLIKGVAKEVKKYQYIFTYIYINNDYFSGETQLKIFLTFSADSKCASHSRHRVHLYSHILLPSVCSTSATPPCITWTSDSMDAVITVVATISAGPCVRHTVPVKSACPNASFLESLSRFFWTPWESRSIWPHLHEW